LLAFQKIYAYLILVATRFCVFKFRKLITLLYNFRARKMVTLR